MRFRSRRCACPAGTGYVGFAAFQTPSAASQAALAHSMPAYTNQATYEVSCQKSVLSSILQSLLSWQ